MQVLETETQETPSKHHPGCRKRALNPDTILKLETLFQHGVNVTVACQMVGISRQTYYKELKENPEFADKINQSRALFTWVACQRVSKILMHGSDRDAGLIALKIMEKTMPDVYGKPSCKNCARFRLQQEELEHQS